MPDSFQLSSRGLEEALAEWKEMEAELTEKARKKFMNEGYRKSDTPKKLKRKRDADARALAKETVARQFREKQLQYFVQVRKDAGVYISAAASEEDNVSALIEF